MEVTHLFDQKPLVYVCAPMVRYSKLEFRSLVRKFGCDLCFTPMIMADSFIKSEKARNNEFTTDASDNPLVVQFAGTNATEFVEATELVSPYSNGVDINCGCPQRWAMKIGIGAQLLFQPEVIRDIVHQIRNRVRHSYSVSVKMRLLNDARDSVSLCQQLQSAGADFITVHGRTKDAKSDPVNIKALRTITDSVDIPIIANGDVKSLEDAVEMHKLTNCKGVMAARGMLTNPAMFCGYNETPRECVRLWIATALDSHLYFITFHHHLVFMLEKVLRKSQRRIFNSLNTYQQVLEFLNDYYNFDFTYEPTVGQKEGLWEKTASNGAYFLEKTEPEYSLCDTFFIS